MFGCMQGDLKDVSKLQKKQNNAIRSRRKPNAQGLFSSRLDDDYLVTVGTIQFQSFPKSNLTTLQRSLLNQQTYRNPMVTSPNSLQQPGQAAVCECQPPPGAGAMGAPGAGGYGAPEIWVPNQMPAVFHQVASPPNIFVDMGADETGNPQQTEAPFAQRNMMSRWRTSNKWYMAPFRQFAKIKDRSRRADFLARFLFPLSFFLFNVTYWVIFQPGTMPPPPQTK